MSTDAWPAEAFIPRQHKFTWEEIEADPRNLELAAHQAKLDSREAAMHQVEALMAAGWRFEIVSESGTEPWQWAWRSPPKRANSEGRRYASTQQAFNALTKSG